MKPSELIADPAKWIKRDLALDSKFQPVGPNHSTACMFCINGAVLRCYNETLATQAFADIRRVLRERGHFSDISMFNDNRTHEEVIELLKAAGH